VEPLHHPLEVELHPLNFASTFRRRFLRDDDTSLFLGLFLLPLSFRTIWLSGFPSRSAAPPLFYFVVVVPRYVPVLVSSYVVSAFCPCMRTDFTEKALIAFFLPFRRPLNFSIKPFPNHRCLSLYISPYYRVRPLI